MYLHCAFPSNRRFPSCLSPLFQRESKCEAFHMEISFIHTQILVHLHVNKTDSHIRLCTWTRFETGERQLGNCLLMASSPCKTQCCVSRLLPSLNYAPLLSSLPSLDPLLPCSNFLYPPLGALVNLYCKTPHKLLKVIVLFKKLISTIQNVCS